jgi:hypothetical protein
MVNLKKGILFLFITLLSSCGDYYLATPDGGGLRSKRKYKWFIKSRINPESIGIDTEVIYKKTHSYKNGTVYSFNVDSSKVLNKNSFDPEKGDIGFVIKRGDKYLHMFYTLMDAGQFLKSGIRMKDDTLGFYFKNRQDEFLSYYKKIKVPKEWLDYDPDY